MTFAVILKCLTNLIVGIHDERTVARNGLAERTTCEQERATATFRALRNEDIPQGEHGELPSLHFTPTVADAHGSVGHVDECVVTLWERLRKRRAVRECQVQECR